MTYKQELEEWITKLQETDKIILVEGKKDKAALASLGITNVITLNRRPLFEVVEDIAAKYKDCILLVDLDKEGKKLYGKLNSGLSRHGVRVDKKFREFLQRKTKLKQIEGIDTYFKRISS